MKTQGAFSEANINNDSREESQDYSIPEIPKGVHAFAMSRPKTVTQPRKGYDKNPFSNFMTSSTKHQSSQNHMNNLMIKKQSMD